MRSDYPPSTSLTPSWIVILKGIMKLKLVPKAKGDFFRGKWNQISERKSWYGPANLRLVNRQPPFEKTEWEVLPFKFHEEDPE